MSDEVKRTVIKPHVIYRAGGGVAEGQKKTSMTCGQCLEATEGVPMMVMERRQDTSTLICNHCGNLETHFNTDFEILEK